MKITPIGKRILVKRQEPKQKLKGGLFLPDSSKQPQEFCEVISTGNIDDILINPGDIILKGKYSGQEVTVEDQSYFILNIDDILGIMS